MLTLTRRSRHAVDIWPGFVDALASVLIVFVFMLLIFVVVQFFMTDVLVGRDKALDQLTQRINELADTLSMEREETATLKDSLDRLTAQLSATVAERDALSSRLSLATQRADTAGAEVLQLRERLNVAATTIAAGKEQIEMRLREIASLQQDLKILRKLRGKLETEVGVLADQLKQRDGELAAAKNRSQTQESRVTELRSQLKQREETLFSLRDRSKALEVELADEQERTRLAQVEIDKRDIRLRELAAIVSAADKELVEQQALGEQAQAQVALLNQQIAALREQIAGLSKALELSELSVEDYKKKVADLGERLNVALAEKVQELHKYRSEFFGRLREVLGDHPDIRIVGDRFLFQSELLFPSGSADLEIAGKQQLDQLAETLRAIAETIPSDVDWILRVDGHTDRRPINTERFPSNWELSTARALSIVAYLINKGISPNRLAAAGFGEFYPIDPSDTLQAYSRNRRIEIKFTGP